MKLLTNARVEKSYINRWLIYIQIYNKEALSFPVIASVLIRFCKNKKQKRMHKRMYIRFQPYKSCGSAANFMLRSSTSLAQRANFTFSKKTLHSMSFFSHRQVCFTDLHCKSTSLRVGHIPMRNPLRGRPSIF